MDIEKFYSTALGISEGELTRQLAEETEHCRVEKGEILVRAGELQGQVPLLVSGVVRGFLLDLGGREITDCFAFRPGSAVMACFEIGVPSPISLEALTECELLSFPMELAERLVDSYAEAGRVYAEMLGASLRRHWELKVMLYQRTAMERYNWFLKNYPGLIDQVKHRHVASFLGISPVTLSRLRGSGRT